MLRWCASHSITVGLVGAPPARQRLDYHAGDCEEQLLTDHRGTLVDLRGRTTLIQLAGACRKARAVVSVDAGPMHVAAGVGTPTLAVVGNDAEAIGSPIRLWLPRSSNLNRTVIPQAAASAARTDSGMMAALPTAITACRAWMPSRDQLVRGKAGMNLLVVTNLYPPGAWRLRTINCRFRLGPSGTRSQHPSTKQRCLISWCQQRARP